MALAAPLPIGAALLFAGYLLAWLVALRLLLAGLELAARRCLNGCRGYGVLAAVFVFVLGMPPLYVGLQVHRIQVPSTPSACAGIAPTTVELRSADGVRLVASVWHGEPAPRAIAVVCHGLGANRSAMMGHVAICLDNGCDVLALDLRGHGDSGGAVTTLGASEVADVEAAVAWLRTFPHWQRVPLLLVGVSMGAATVLRAANSVGAAAVHAESAFADLDHMICAQTALLGPLSSAAAVLIAWHAHWMFGVDAHAVSPRAALTTLPSAVAVRLLHAGDDRVVPVIEGERLAAARPGQVLEVVAAASHGDCLGADPERVRRSLADLVQSLPISGASPSPRTPAVRPTAGTVLPR
jgi:uncharacterized protein